MNELELVDENIGVLVYNNSTNIGQRFGFGFKHTKGGTWK